MRARPPVSAAVRLGIALLCSATLGGFLAGCRAHPPAAVAVKDAAADLSPIASASPAPQPTDNRCAQSPASDLDAERDAVARDLAIDPDDPEKLAAAAELYLSRLSASTSHSEIGLLYARRGLEQLERRISAGKKPAKRGSAAPSPRLSPKFTAEQRELFGRLSLLEGEALLDLGQAQNALERIDLALRSSHDATVELHAHYERAVALFELCQLPAAKSGFDAWLVHHASDTSDTVAFVHHHLGLTLELLGDETAARRELAAARQLRPEQFPELLPIEMAEFRKVVDKEVKALPAESRADLKLATLEVSEVPDLRDLTLENPPLSPTLVGLFRGLPVGEEPSEPRTIVLYRRNLLRIVRSREELSKEVHTTLLHELGHLRGADEEDLRERGLE
jgi:predicted Zn-dependent protease with MMP-like domain